MIALYLFTRSLQFIARYIWRHYLEKNWDPHARAREIFSKEKPVALQSGGMQRDLGKTRLPARKQILTDYDYEEELDPASRSPEDSLVLYDSLRHQ